MIFTRYASPVRPSPRVARLRRPADLRCPACGGAGYRLVTVDYEPDPRDPLGGERPIREPRDCAECGGTGSRRAA